MSLKTYVKDLEGKLEAYKYFEDDNLKHLNGSCELTYKQRELFERALPFKGTDKYEGLMSFVDKIDKANQSYDTMYVKYMQYKQKFEEMRTYATNLAKVVKKYELEEELLTRISQEI